jgi:hypothetical protein
VSVFLADWSPHRANASEEWLRARPTLAEWVRRARWHVSRRGGEAGLLEYLAECGAATPVRWDPADDEGALRGALAQAFAEGLAGWRATHPAETQKRRREKHRWLESPGIPLT